MSSLEITGKLFVKYDTVPVSERFKKREFVLELIEEVNGNNYTNYAKMQLVQNKCDLLDKFNLGDNVKVSFNVKGQRSEKDGKVAYFTNLDAWKIEAVGVNNNTPVPESTPAYNPSPANDDDLPF